MLALAPIPAAFSETLADVQNQIERTSAQLAQVRTRAESDTGSAQAAAIGSGRDLERSKSRLIDLENVKIKEAIAAAKAAAAEAAAAQAAQAASAASTAALVPKASNAFGTATATTESLDKFASFPAAPAATSGVDATALDAYLAGKGSPLAGAGAAFVASAGQVGLDPRMLVAISGAETSFGTYGPSQLIHNPFGMGPGRVYGSWEEAIAAAANNLAGPIYLGAGKVTIGQISGTWAPLGAVNDPSNLNSNWTRNVSRYYAEMGGDPASSVFTSSPSLAPGPVGSRYRHRGRRAGAHLPGPALRVGRREPADRVRLQRPRPLPLRAARHLASARGGRPGPRGHLHPALRPPGRRRRLLRRLLGLHRPRGALPRQRPVRARPPHRGRREGVVAARAGLRRPGTRERGGMPDAHPLRSAPRAPIGHAA